MAFIAGEAWWPIAFCFICYPVSIGMYYSCLRDHKVICAHSIIFYLLSTCISVIACCSFGRSCYCLQCSLALSTSFTMLYINQNHRWHFEREYCLGHDCSNSDKSNIHPVRRVLHNLARRTYLGQAVFTVVLYFSKCSYDCVPLV